MSFDIDGAKKAGYSDSEIADYLSSQNKFDAAGARSAGYSDPEIISHLTPQQPEPSLVSQLGRQVGLTARAGLGGLGGVANMVLDPAVQGINSAAGTNLPIPSQAMERFLSSFLPEPANATERVAQAGARSLVPIGGGASLAKNARSLAPLADNLGWQSISSVLGSTASETAKETGAGPWGQAGAGLVAGIAGPTALSAAGAGARAALRVPGSLLAPMTEAGRQNIVARAYQKAASDSRGAADNIDSAQQFVPGVQPNTAEVAGDNGISSLYKALVNRQPALFADRAGSNDQARQAFLSQAFGGPADVAAAQSARDAVTSPMREAAFANASPVDTAPIVVGGQRVLDSGAKYRGSGPMLQKFVNDISEINDPQVLYNGPRKAINDALSGQASRDSPLAQFTKAELIGLKGHIDDLIEQSAPGFKDYMRTHADLSRPIDARQLGQDITAAATNPLTERLSPAQFARQMASRQQDVAKSGPVTSDTLMRVNEDLKRSAAPLNAMRTAGSDTTQNLVGNSMLNGLLGRLPLGPLGSVTGKLGSLLYSPFENKTQQLAMDAMLDPQLAAGLLRRPIPQKPDLVAQFLASRFPITYGGLLGTASNQ